MLLLLTIALVLIGAVALVIGFVQEAMFPIYLSIACSLGAAVVLVLFTRLSRGRLATAAGTAPLEDEPRLSADLPITDYDERRVAEIVPLLGDLDRSELQAVRSHEADGRNRTTVIRRIDDLLEDQSDVDSDDDVDADAGEDTLVGAAAAFGRDSDDEDLDDDDNGESDDMFPIAEYDDLKTSQILPLLDELTDDELEEVADHEVDGENRAAILDRIDALLGDEAEAPPKKAGAKKAGAKKKAAAKKAPAKKSGATKKAPAKKSTAKKAGVTKKAGATKKAPAKKSGAKKSGAKKSGAKKAGAKKAGAKKSR